MQDEEVSPVAVIAEEGTVVSMCWKWGMDDVIGPKGRKPYYHFEKVFDGYRKFFRNRNDAEGIDLVTSFNGTDEIPLEIKLTVVPDFGTASKKEHLWGPELVVRPVSSAYSMMGLAASLLEPQNSVTREKVINHLSPAYGSITNWTSNTEIKQQAQSLRNGLDAALKESENLQKPFLIQPIWKTQGQSIALCEQCFDVFVWSDVAIMRVPVDLSYNKSSTRALREVARHVRALHDILSQGDYDYESIYKGTVAGGGQTDKSFAISGRKTNEYLRHSRLRNPHYHKDILQKIILNRGELNLKPERRFDLAVVAQMAKGLQQNSNSKD